MQIISPKSAQSTEGLEKASVHHLKPDGTNPEVKGSKNLQVLPYEAFARKSNAMMVCVGTIRPTPLNGEFYRKQGGGGGYPPRANRNTLGAGCPRSRFWETTTADQQKGVFDEWANRVGAEAWRFVNLPFPQPAPKPLRNITQNCRHLLQIISRIPLD